MDGTPWNEYPRPCLKRDSFLCLNGEWEFGISEGKPVYDRRIVVPFPPESKRSGAELRHRKGQILHYRRSFCLPKGFLRDRVLLHFGAVDQECRICLNGREVGTHCGGYLAFTLDVTDCILPGENVLVVEVRDDLDHRWPWGKQKEKNGGMWYTPFSGIWQTVWLESVPADFIRELQIRTDLQSVQVTVLGGAEEKRMLVDGREVRFRGNTVTVTIPAPRLWTPEEPNLYRFVLESGEDRVESYFALRTVGSGVVDGIPRLLLNGKPYFFHGLLDQGYWQDGICTPESPEAMEQDLLLAKKLGFNTLRKHIKIEPEVYYEACDRLGLVVWQDMVNMGSYRFVRDTALPTVGFRKRSDRRFSMGDGADFAEFLNQMTGTVEQLRNHPCIVLWTIFNEGWGQCRADEAYDVLKKMDPDRLIDSTSGWFHQKKSDVESLHVYFRPFVMEAAKRPVILSEFGGYSFRVEHHCFSKKNYGYRTIRTREEYSRSLAALYEEQILPAVSKGLCAAIYTQLSDVEEETNGLVTYDRAVEKVSVSVLRPVSESLKCRILSNGQK